MSLSWAAILGVIFVLGCGGTDNPIGEEIQELPTEPPTNIDSSILGDWRLVEIIWFKDEVEFRRTGPGHLDWLINDHRIVLTLAPDGIFEVTERWPMHEEELFWLELEGWEHIQEIIVTFLGKYRIGMNQLQLNLIVTRVDPKEEGPKIRTELENPVLLYDIWIDDGGAMDYFLTDDGNQLELIREKGEYSVKFIHRRPKTEQSMS